MRDNQTALIAKLTSNEFTNLNKIVFTQYNQTFKLVAVARGVGRKVVTVRLHTGIDVDINVDNTVALS